MLKATASWPSILNNLALVNSYKSRYGNFIGGQFIEPKSGQYFENVTPITGHSKRRYFYGLRIHALVTGTGEPIDVFLAPGAEADVRALHRFQFDLPTGSTLYADSAFTHYPVEDLMQEVGISFQPLRKKNSKRPVPPYAAYLQARGRKIVETTGSLIVRLLPKSIHAVTSPGFEFKVMLFVLACSVSCAV